MKLLRKFIWLVLVLVIGGIGGVVFERTLIPYLASREPFASIPRLTLERVTVVNPKEEVIIDKAQALERATEVARTMLVRVVALDAAGEPLTVGSGVTITSDGIIATMASAVPESADALTVFRNGGQFPAEILRTDEQQGIVLLKIEASGLPVPSFASASDIPLGRTLLLLRADSSPEGSVTPHLATGMVTAQPPQEGAVPETSLIFDARAVGAPVFTHEVQFLGIASGTSTGAEIIPVSAIQQLLEAS